MPCLVDLSDELHLNIIQELLDHDMVVHQKSLEPKPKWNHQKRNDEFQSHRDLMNWSCTSPYFRNLLAPYIFSSIKLRNDEKSGASVDAVLKGPHGALVKEIYFLGTIPPGMAFPDDDGKDDEPVDEGFHKDSDGAEEEEKPITITFPPIVDTLLSDLHQFPSLESLSIGITYPYGNCFDKYYDREEFMKGENPEGAHAWKALMTTTYETLLRNEPAQLKAVEIRKLAWTFIKPFESQSFHIFLSHVEHFSLSLRGGEDRACWSGNSCDGYLECVARFDELFFDHLASAAGLTLKAPDQGPIGLEGVRHARLALKQEQMPRLKSLHLEHIFICQELVDFVASHTNTLEQLSLHDCSSSVNGLQDNDGFYWNHFFDALHGAHLKKLSRLEIWPHNASLTHDEAIDRRGYRVQNRRAEPDDVQKIRRVLGEDANRRIFGYASLELIFGACEEDEKENKAAFERGEDQVAFDRLMENVNANAAKGGENPIGK